MGEHLLYFHQIIYSETTINPTKINEVKTVPCYGYELMKPSTGITNLPSLLPHVLTMKFVSTHFNFHAKK